LIWAMAPTMVAAQEPVFGDPEIDKPPSRAYRDAIRLRTVGVKVGEVTSTSAIVWTRVPPPDEMRYRRKKDLLEWIRSLFLEDDLQVRIRYGKLEDGSDGQWSAWEDADPRNDFTHQWTLNGLEPGTAYHFEIEAADERLRPLYEPRIGRFRTAPAANVDAPITFTVITGQRYDRLDDPRGFEIYPSMARLDPDFLVLTGDTVYYDRGPLKARNVEIARDRWRRTYELPRLLEFHSVIPAYWEKDDHDAFTDDSWPGSKPYGSLTFRDGVRIFEEHTPQGDLPYRTVRWGRLLQIWLTEVREFRSDPDAPDGPEKSIFGFEQKRWLKQTLAASDAVWKVLVNPTPIVGPDRSRFKKDNHANRAWSHEGDELRSWFTEALGEEFVLVAGDRHWQYHSVHPETGLHEYGCGPATDAHAGGSPGFDSEYHRFHRVAGGFLSVSVGRAGDESWLAVRHHAVDGPVVHEDRRTLPLPGAAPITNGQ
jgi:alkaline phosphatase D